MNSENLSYKIIGKEDTAAFTLISAWYQQEWNMAPELTRARLERCGNEGLPFHLLLYVNGLPVATGGIYRQANIQQPMPHLLAFEPWLSLVYTCPEHRGKGYGAAICRELEKQAALKGLKKLYLFTYTAEPMYTNMQWDLTEQFHLKDRHISIMKKS
ncbi:MAG TPA: GNAT family N-acetyltransferase, partial [Flavisolibacter sp.]|nr:GNAT family N-acetyltransferase [Flavisolibacter sp.]